MTRLACAIGVHTAGMTVAEAARRFEADTHLAGPAALSEARRATFDPTYGRYTWGKLEIMRTRDAARAAWGSSFTLKRFHSALMELGSPPLGLIGTAIERGLSPAGQPDLHDHGEARCSSHAGTNSTPNWGVKPIDPRSRCRDAAAVVIMRIPDKRGISATLTGSSRRRP